METYRSSEEIREQFADAAAALVMDRYLGQMQEAMDDEPLPEIPAALDEKCRDLIRKRLRKKQWKQNSKKVLHYAKTAVIAVVMLFGIGGILFTTVEAVRVPIINFFLEHGDGYLVIGGENADGPHRADFSPAHLDAVLADALPGYRQENFLQTSTGSFTIVYANAEGDTVILLIAPDQSTLHIDTEQSTAESLTILGCEAVLVVKDGCQLVWFHEERGELLQLDATALSREEIIALAERIEGSR